MMKLVTTLLLLALASCAGHATKCETPSANGGTGCDKGGKSFPSAPYW